MSTLNPFMIERDSEPDREFEGKVVANGLSHGDQSHCDARRAVIRLFRTECNLWVAETADVTQYRCVVITTRSVGAVSSEPGDLVESIGNRRAAKALHISAGSVLPRHLAAVG